MYEEFFSLRLAELRMQKGVSARDMSLSIWQSENYHFLAVRVKSPHAFIRQKLQT